MTTDPIADMLTRIRNAQRARHKSCEIPASNLKTALAQILVERNYIARFLHREDGRQGLLKLYLKYTDDDRPVIRGLVRVSSPGRRVYAQATNLPRVRNGLGIAILSTNRGVMTDKEAAQLNVGGEILCKIW